MTTDLTTFNNVTIDDQNQSTLGFSRKASESNIALPEWEAIITGITLTIIIILTIIGNILVALSVFTSRHLRLVQNYYIVSLAVADLTVAIFVQPFSVVYIISGRWLFGLHVCKMWLTLDVMCCTSSILNLCIIALDRYWSIATPIANAHKRTKKYVLLFIALIWIISFLISSPPLIGWNNWPAKFDRNTPCELTDDRGYVLYSALGSFYIPLFIMTFVYFKIYLAMRKRLRQRAFIDTLYPLSIVESSPEQPNAVQTTPTRGFNYEASFKQPIVSTYSKLRRFLSTEIPSQTTSQNTTLPRPYRTEVCDDTDPTIVGILMKQKYQSIDTAEPNSPKPIGDDSNDNEPSSPTYNMKEFNTLKGDQNDELVNCKSPPDFRRFTNAAQFRQRKNKVVLQRERRAARTLSVIMGAFVICWLPFFLMYITGPFCGSLCPSLKVRNFLTWLGYINSGLNPIIYTIFNVDYRKAFKRLLGFRKGSI